MSTNAETVERSALECDQRRLPGDGQRTKCNHIVRIVVVPRVKPQAPESHGLSDLELKEGETVLKKMPASAHSGQPGPTNLFEELKPTDIVVIGKEPASVRLVDKDGHGAARAASGAPSSDLTRRLFAHNHCHQDTVLRVWTDSDTVEYQCDRAFEIVRVERSGWKLYGTAEDPFENSREKAPYRATEARDASGKPVWTWKSGVVPASANNQQYKATFLIDGQEIDPDVVCGDPPPSP
jgi:hypothetical protein